MLIGNWSTRESELSADVRGSAHNTIQLTCSYCPVKALVNTSPPSGLPKPVQATHQHPLQDGAPSDLSGTYSGAVGVSCWANHDAEQNSRQALHHHLQLELQASANWTILAMCEGKGSLPILVKSPLPVTWTYDTLSLMTRTKCASKRSALCGKIAPAGE
jgi:hypothetical protein